MKSLLLITLLIPTLSLAQRLPDYDVQMVREHAYVSPRSLNFTLQRSHNPRADACGFAKELMKNISSDYVRLNCKSKPNDNLCKSISDMVVNFAQGENLAQYGGRVSAFDIKTKQLDQARIARVIGEELQIASERVHVIVPEAEKASFAFTTTQEDNFFLKLLSVFDLPLGLHHIGATIISEDRLSTCALLDKAVNVSGEINTQLVVATERPIAETYSLYGLYHGVSNDWSRIEGKKWKNPLHQILYIANILQENMKTYRAEKLYPMEQLYDVLFASYIQQDEFSIYLNKFKDMNDFASKVHPPFQDELTMSVQLVQN